MKYLFMKIPSNEGTYLSIIPLQSNFELKFYGITKENIHFSFQFICIMLWYDLYVYDEYLKDLLLSCSMNTFQYLPRIWMYKKINYNNCVFSSNSSLSLSPHVYIHSSKSYLYDIRKNSLLCYYWNRKNGWGFLFHIPIRWWEIYLYLRKLWFS